MIITTMNDLPGYDIEEILGEVFGLTVRSRNIGSQMGAGLKSLVGGELKGMTKMLAEGRDHARQRLVEEAASRGANAIIASLDALPAGSGTRSTILSDPTRNVTAPLAALKKPSSLAPRPPICQARSTPDREPPPPGVRAHRGVRLED